ncbi:MAG TPA: DNA cytosine methyltransferase [Candidatus Sulfotelmatobacter sp.]|nr:DNA cytosine methyltransferase [Candidatus Sulfotelmatobacter sp.]
MKPLCIDLYSGLGGWADGFLAEGYDVVGFDIERHVYGSHKYPAQLVLQDVLTLHGSQFRDAACIVASPPCQAYSYRAMPWKRAKALPPPDNSLFEACFRIQREASEAATESYGCAKCGVFHPATTLDGCDFEPRHIPLIVENVQGAQRWVGRARWHYGSFYLWGDVPALMPHKLGFKNNGGSWFAVAHNTKSGHIRNPVNDPIKSSREYGGWFNDYKGEHCVGISRTGSKSPARKAASALIARIPFELARHIAAVYKPHQPLCFAAKSV